MNGKRFAAALLILAVLAAEILAAAPPPIRLDLHGDPLPAGAISRLGSMRLRHLCMVVGILAISPDDSKVASVGKFGARRIRVWDRATGRLLHEFEPGGFRHQSLRFSPDSKKLLSCGSDQVWIWDLTTGRRQPLWTGQRGMPGGLAFDGIGRTLAVRCLVREGNKEFSRIHLYDFPSLKERAVVTPSDRTESEAAVLSPDGQRLIFGSSRALRIWDVKAGKEVARFALDGSSRCLAVSPDGKTIACNSYKGLVTLIHPGARQPVVTTSVRSSISSGLGFSADSKEVLYAPSAGGPVIALDAVTGRQTRVVVPGKDPWDAAGVFSTLGDWLVRFRHDRRTPLMASVVINDLRTGKETPPFDDHRDGSAIEAIPSPDGRRVATQSVSELRIWDLRTGMMLRRIGGEDFVPGLRWARGGKALVVARPGELSWYDADTGKRLQRWRLPPGMLRRAALLPDEKQVSCHVEDREGHSRLLIVDLKSPAGPWPFSTATPRVGGPPLSPDGGRLLSWQWKGEGPAAQLVDTRSRRTIWQHSLLGTFPTGAFSPDGSRVVVLTRQELVAWQAATGRRVGGGAYTEQQKGEIPTILCVSPDGRTTVVGLRHMLRSANSFQSSQSTYIQLLETLTGKVRKELPLLPLVSSAVFTGGRHLVTASADGSALVWDSVALARAVTAHPWDDLASSDGRTAFAAVASLVAAPKQAVRLLAGRLRPARVDTAQVRAWIADLDAESFQRRAEAERHLAGLHEHVEEDLRDALHRNLSTEVRVRLERLLRSIEKGSPEQWRRSRAVEVLEQVGSPGARRLLAKIATGHAGSSLTREAKESLARLERP
jgi:WD40 repeat protein